MKIWPRTYLWWFKEDTDSTITRQIRLVRNKKNWSPVRTDEFTIPIVQVGWGRGFERTRWYRNHVYSVPSTRQEGYSGPGIAPGPYDDDDRDWFDQTVERHGRESFEPPPGR